MPSIRRNIRFTPHPVTSASLPGQAGVLVVDDDARILSLLAGALRGTLGELPLLRAQSVKEALRVAASHEIRLFILDVELPDGTGLDFYRQVREDHPAAPVIVITGTPLIVDENFGERFGTRHVLRKPFDIVALQRLVKQLLFDPPPAPKPEPHTFAATLHSLTPTDLIQLKCIGKATSTLRFTSSDGRSGLIHFERGEIIHAEAGTDKGMDAFNRIVTWKGGEVSEIAARPVKRTLQGSWEILLMDALRLADEAQTRQ